ncbi:hypothetical protein N9Z87_00555, partial [Amylibacter sp.]|nr:hypothetical protein [Amylibacter sp.]
MRFLIILALGILASCGVRETTFKDGTVQRDLIVGLKAFEGCSNTQMISGRETNVGVWAGKTGTGLGLTSNRFACGPPACQAVVWVPNSTT